MIDLVFLVAAISFCCHCVVVLLFFFFVMGVADWGYSQDFGRGKGNSLLFEVISVLCINLLYKYTSRDAAVKNC